MGTAFPRVPFEMAPVVWGNVNGWPAWSESTNSIGSVLAEVSDADSKEMCANVSHTNTHTHTHTHTLCCYVFNAMSMFAGSNNVAVWICYTFRRHHKTVCNGNVKIASNRKRYRNNERVRVRVRDRLCVQVAQSLQGTPLMLCWRMTMTTIHQNF